MLLIIEIGSLALLAPTQWVAGLNKYSHDAGVCLLSTCGRRSIIVPNERLSRVKHDGGDTAAAVGHALKAVGGSLEDIVAVCANNHHHRIAPFEARLPWSVPMGLYPASALADENLIPNARRFELSHHLSHVWSAIAQAPFERGLVVVMDGMGETYAAMHAGGDDSYMHDLQLPEAPGFVTVPSAEQLGDLCGHREAESAYLFDGDTVSRVFKRWVPQRSPSELYNHGFENLESVGALYSRISSHVFGDWNACGKVMGLAPWSEAWVGDAWHADLLAKPLVGGQLDGTGDASLSLKWRLLEQLPAPNGFGALQRSMGPGLLAESAELPPEVAAQRALYTALSARVQADLERTALEWLRNLQKATGERHLCFVGGVAQNSVLNGRIAREAGFEQVFIPPYPGDEGVAVGCAAYAQRVILPRRLGVRAPPRRTVPWSAYQGAAYSESDVLAALDEFAPWIEAVVLDANGRERPGERPADGGSAAAAGSAGGVSEAAPGEADGEDSCQIEAELEAALEAELEAALEAAAMTAAEPAVGPADATAAGAATTAALLDADEMRSWDAPTEAVVQYTAAALARGEIVGWVTGRAEVGARALGHRSILANPALAQNHRKVNVVKQREQWRPLAPSVLAEEADAWFDGLPASASPYMQITAMVRPEVQSRVPAITHVDGSARLQTVCKDEAPIYHALISALFALIGVPMVMNTSFNLASMPIVESPADAISCFLEADAALSLLVLHGRVLRRRPFPQDEALRAAVPTQQCSFVSRTLSDPTGQASRVEVLVDGKWIELTDALELEVLEQCAAGSLSASALSEQMARQLSAEEDRVSQEDVIERLRHLYALRLISMELDEY